MNFKEYFIKEQMLLGSHPHSTTRTRHKGNVIRSENDFFKALRNIEYSQGAVLLGVVGSPHATGGNPQRTTFGMGWKLHERQYRNLGFDLNNVFLCENQPREYYALLYNYITDVCGINIRKANDVLPKELPREFYAADSGISYLFDHARTTIVAIKKQNRAALIFGELTPQSINLNIKAHKPIESLIGNNYQNRVEHVDLDITSSVNQIQTVINTTNAFFNGYQNLKSLVQVYEFRRGLPELANDVAAQVWYNQQTPLINFITNLNDKNVDQERKDDYKDACIGLKRLIDSGQTRSQETAELLRDALTNDNKHGWIQLYPGAVRAQMISIAVTKAQEGEVAEGVVDQIIDENQRNKYAEDVKTLYNHAVKREDPIQNMLLNNFGEYIN